MMTLEDWCAAWTQADNKLRELTLAARALVHEVEVTSNYTSPDLQEKLDAVNRIVWPAPPPNPQHAAETIGRAADGLRPRERATQHKCAEQKEK